jgi:HTH-type transcriptional regulator / antitoxin HigA
MRLAAICSENFAGRQGAIELSGHPKMNMHIFTPGVILYIVGSVVHIESQSRSLASAACSPGEFIKQSLAERGWSQVELAEILGRPPRLISELIAAKRAVTPETARGLADAFGTSANYWMDLESQWQLSRLQLPDDSVARRSKLYSLYPVKEMVRRGWVTDDQDIGRLEQNFKKFFCLPEPARGTPPAAFRRGVKFTQGAQDAWVIRARQIAVTMQVKPYDAAKLSDCIQSLKLLLEDPAQTQHVPGILAAAGIRYLLIEPIINANIDGVCFWLDPHSPVIAQSLRADRIDSYWFTLFHELMHVKYQDCVNDVIVDSDLADDAPADLPDFERRADQEAQALLIPEDELRFFIQRVRPLYSHQRVSGFAQRLRIHPGIVVGQLQRRREISYANLRKLLEKIRHHIVPKAVVDGWGYLPHVEV